MGVTSMPFADAGILDPTLMGASTRSAKNGIPAPVV
jgi:hypothetical protein